MNQQHSESKTSWVVIVGASSGIGRALAHRWAAGGSDLILAGRDIDDLERSAADLRIRHGVEVRVISLDVLDFSAHVAFWNQCLAIAAGEVGGMIVAHGSLPLQAELEHDLELMRQTIDTNFTSAISILTPVANEFEKNRRGFICVLSSVAGDRGRQSNYVYCSAKAGLTAFLGGLRNRLFKSNVTVLTVKPGFVDTGMIWGKPGVFLVASPQRVAADVFRAVRRGRAEIYTPWFWRYIMLVIRCIPEFVFKRMKL